MKIKLTTLLLAILFGTGSLFAQNGIIEGKVFDNVTQEPLYGATVSLTVQGELMGTTTDFDGKFKISGIPSGNYTISISYVGYAEQKIEGVRVNSDRITLMENTNLQVGEMDAFVLIEWKEKLIDPEDPKKMIMLEGEIKKNPNRGNTLAMIANASSEIYQKDENQPLYFRGSRAGDAVYFVDGMKSSEVNVSVPAAAIGGISVYTAGVPAKYGDVTGGVVVIETKSYFDLLNE